ncbi:MAG: hypothetical protein ACOVSW_16455 [Candidatus Kapaibacteriota bacterium]
MQTLAKPRTTKKSPKNRASSNSKSTESTTYSVGDTEIVIMPGSFADVNRKAIGAISSGIPDLATNKEYMNDFGLSRRQMISIKMPS